MVHADQLYSAAVLRGAAELFACYLLFKAAITQCAGVEPVFISIVGDTHCSSHQPLALSLNPSHKHTSEESHKCTHVKCLNSYEFVRRINRE